jgi:hypothetical protein
MNIPLLILGTVLIISIQGMIYKQWGLRKVEYSRFFVENSVFEGDNVQLVEVISNSKFLPVPWLRLESRINPGLKFQKQSNLDIKHHEFHKSFFSLMPYTKITRRHTVNCSKRGYYLINSAALSCNDLFNMVQLSKELTLSANITVYPKIHPIHELNMASYNWNGDVVVRRWIIDDPFMVSGVREYRYGDPMNRINWKSTARTGKLQVYNTDYTSNVKFMILLNIEVDEFAWNSYTDEELMEKWISHSASLANYSISGSIETGFGCNGCLDDLPQTPVLIPPGCSIEQMKNLLETLARMTLKRSVQFHTLLDEIVNTNVKNTDFLIISAFESHHMKTSIKKIRELGNSVEMLHIS